MDRLLALPYQEARDELDRAYIGKVLAECGGKLSVAAKRLGMDRGTLRTKVRALGLRASD